MKRNYIIALATCHKCKATCVEGHDDDGQIFCACCGHSYIPSEVKKVTVEEYKKVSETANASYEKGGWKAFKHSK